MTTDEAINTAANVPALIAAVLATATVFVYARGSRGSWRTSLLGIAFASLIVVVLPIFGIVFGRRFAGDYPGFGWVALGGYILVDLIYVAIIVAIVAAQRNGNTSARPPIHDTKEHDHA
jgi:hypothetical protein